MKLRDAEARLPYDDSVRYVARIEIPLSPDGIRRIQKSVQAFAREPARVVVTPTRCMGLIHERGPESLLLCDVSYLSAGVVTNQQQMHVSKLKVLPQDVIRFTLLPGGSLTMRSYYRGMVRDWASDLIVEEVEWASWIALATKVKGSISRGN